MAGWPNKKSVSVRVGLRQISNEEVGQDPAQHGQAFHVQPCGGGFVKKDLAACRKVLVLIVKYEKEGNFW